MRLLKANEFNKEANINATNCFAFALGLTENGGRYELPRKRCRWLQCENCRSI